MVQNLFLDLCAKGYEQVSSTHAVMAEAAKPQKFYSETAEMFFCPDVSAEKEGVPVYFEVETEDSLDSAMTRAEIECFLSHAKKVGAYFYLVVPLPVRERAVSLLREFENKDNHRVFVLTL